jgi:hypothetical protein
MTTPAREEAPERVLLPCPFCGKPPHACPDTSYGSATVFCPDENECPVQPVADAELKDGETLADAITRWNTRADLANREPSEGDVERIGRAVWAALSDAPLPDRDCQREMEKAGLAAINAWRNP